LNIMSDENVKTIFVTLLLMLIIFIIKAAVVCCPCFNFFRDLTIKDAVYALFREVVLVVISLLTLL
jgi:hypothetical protein